MRDVAPLPAPILEDPEGDEEMIVFCRRFEFGELLRDFVLFQIFQRPFE